MLNLHDVHGDFKVKAERKSLRAGVETAETAP